RGRPSIAGGVLAAIARADVDRAVVAERGLDDPAVHLRQIITIELVDRLAGEAQSLGLLFHGLSYLSGHGARFVAASPRDYVHEATQGGEPQQDGVTPPAM